jgi:hypothetical protein
VPVTSKTWLLSRLEKIEAKLDTIKSLERYDVEGVGDLRAQLVDELNFDVRTLELEVHKLLLFDDIMDKAFDSVVELLNIVAGKMGGHQLRRVT